MATFVAVQYFSEHFEDDSNKCFFNGNLQCDYKYVSCGIAGEDEPNGMPCINTIGSGYTDPSTVYVLICAILVFFMKGGFMLLESAFANSDEEKRQIIIIKNTDTFASAFGYFFLGCDFITEFVANDFPVNRKFFEVQLPLLWFFEVHNIYSNHCLLILLHEFCISESIQGIPFCQPIAVHICQ
jgi:hypothetical protein